MSECDIQRCVREKWLRQHFLSERLLDCFRQRKFNFAVSVPQSVRKIMVLMQRIFEFEESTGAALLDIEDWSLYAEPEMQVFSKIRSACGESHTLKEAPCHSFNLKHHALLVGIFSLTISFQWKATIYFSKTNWIIHNWEGDYLEFYCPDPKFRKFIQRIALDFDLQWSDGDLT